jgi:hypothetical protein
MVKPAQGFMSEDNNFFETEAEAEFHEAETAMMVVLAPYVTGPACDQFMETCVTHKDAIRRYLNAYETVNQQDHIKSVEADLTSAEISRILASADSYSQDDATRATRDAPLQPQSRDGHSDLSTVGSGSHSETVQDNKAVDGS